MTVLHYNCSDKFDGIRSDPDQLRAAKLLTQLPVVVISGKGGCGKTTVVTKVMSSCESRPEYVYFLIVTIAVNVFYCKSKSFLFCSELYVYTKIEEINSMLIAVILNSRKL